MTRLFKRHKQRQVQLLDGMWKFIADPEKKGFEGKWYDNFPEDSIDMIVPSCWNNELGLYDHEGLAWYCTRFTNSRANINLVFGAVTGQAEVYLDGKHVKSHYGGFTKFSFNINNLEACEHMLVVAVDNTHNSIDTIPLSRVDWFHYGGITRSVELFELFDVWIKDCRIDYTLDDLIHDATLDFSVTLECLGSGKLFRNLNIYIDDRIVSSTQVEIEGEKKVHIAGMVLQQVKLWDIENPIMYNIRFEIEDDDLIDRIGFRNIMINNKKVYLNGKEIYLKGINRHEDHPDWGFSIPLKIMKKDIDIIKSLGCNAIRGAHYPNSEMFLDFCDQEGLLFWEEIPMWQYSDKHFNNPVVLDRALIMIEEMVKRDYHHPCIIIWGLHNEVDTTVLSCFDFSKKLLEKVRGLDAKRLVTYATKYPLDDICYPLADIICVNKYYGWYEGNLNQWVEFAKLLKKKLIKDGLDHVPVVMSEFGADGIYGDSTFEGPKWTENYQEKYLDYTLNLFSSNPDIAGLFIWQYCDIRSPKEMEMMRARSFNNKGVVNEYRKPKLAYWRVQKIYHSLGQNLNNSKYNY